MPQVNVRLTPQQYLLILRTSNFFAVVSPYAVCNSLCIYYYHDYIIIIHANLYNAKPKLGGFLITHIFVYIIKIYTLLCPFVTLDFRKPTAKKNNLERYIAQKKTKKTPTIFKRPHKIVQYGEEILLFSLGLYIF